MNNRKIIIYSVVFSVLFHLLFLSNASNVKIPGVYFIFTKTKRFFKIDKLLKEKVARRKLFRQKKITPPTEALKFEVPDFIESIAGYPEPEEETKKLPLILPKELVSISKRDDVNDLLEDEKDSDMLIKQIQRETREALLTAPEVAAEGEMAAPEELLEVAALPEEFLDKMPGFTPKKTGGFFDSAKQKIIDAVTKRRTAFIARETDFKSLTEYLVHELYTYQDPSDGQKYYQLNIRAGKDTSKLKAIPKEIVFLVDCSLSIQPKRLQEFQRGLHYCLRNLNPEDYFNIIAFKMRTLWFRELPVKLDGKTIKEALDFVSQLTSEEGTDAYNALYKAIKVESVLTPSYIILFSDGRSTQGVTNSREIINRITQVNNGKRPIFAFSGGARVNRYFLDFISYKNRGWSEYASHSALINRHIAGMYDKIKDPLFLNLRYRASGLNAKEIFPKSLPDFFRNAEFTLLGKYEDEDAFSIQFLGDSNGKTNEFIIIDSLSKAPKGGEEITRNWAFNKIYYLIGLLQYDEHNKEIIDEINFLCDKFDITTPYSNELQQ